MNQHMRKFAKRLPAFCLLLVFFLTHPLPARAADFDAQAMKQMSVFLSNFTEIGMLDFEASKTLNPDSPGNMIRFGVWHNFINNYKSRISQCQTANCQWGSLTIKCEYVQDSLKRYFDYDLAQCPTVEDSDPPYHFDGKLYHFEGAAGEATYFARVESAKKLDDGTVQMQGVVYNADDESIVLGTFTALAKPHTWKGKNTWALLSMKTTFSD